MALSAYKPPTLTLRPPPNHAHVECRTHRGNIFQLQKCDVPEWLFCWCKNWLWLQCGFRFVWLCACMFQNCFEWLQKNLIVTMVFRPSCKHAPTVTCNICIPIAALQASYEGSATSDKVTTSLRSTRRLRHNSCCSPKPHTDVCKFVFICEVSRVRRTVACLFRLNTSKIYSYHCACELWSV